ncbi:hypothetical protein Pan97_20770 [Bremerella volcania]|uniref:Uncharacterized protein n=1 Tax=Bremerella volcania TaxID=2527984 RepID=A0A518C753_9BACT|nr:hypothetical protein Pan97_20770 [Bremerella volcania]
MTKPEHAAKDGVLGLFSWEVTIPLANSAATIYASSC